MDGGQTNGDIGSRDVTTYTDTFLPCHCKSLRSTRRWHKY